MPEGDFGFFNAVILSYWPITKGVLWVPKFVITDKVYTPWAKSFSGSEMEFAPWFIFPNHKFATLRPWVS